MYLAHVEEIESSFEVLGAFAEAEDQCLFLDLVMHVTSRDRRERIGRKVGLEQWTPPGWSSSGSLMEALRKPWTYTRFNIAAFSRDAVDRQHS